MNPYLQVQQSVMQLAGQYINGTVSDKRTPWAVFDIDDTVLSMNNAPSRYQRMNKGTLDPVPEMIQLVKDLYNMGYRIAFVTARGVRLADVSLSNLGRFLPIDLVNDAIFFYNNTSLSKVGSKIQARGYIEEHYGPIIFNIGDQQTDLDGGHSLYTYKLPSFY